ncbi:MAG: hypothetical protein IJU19_05155 [Bacteroidales bacterium]|nr:hypothetical protein [Bacteroidales bacterium]
MEDFFSTLDKTSENVLTLLRGKGRDLLNRNTVNSTRAVGDAVQTFLGRKDGLRTCFPAGFLDKFESDFERRSMEDMAFSSGKHYFAVDCKTHNLDTVFNMPNLISVRRLANFYMNDTNVFCLLIVEYSVNGTEIDYTKCYFKPIESFSWDCLTFGALGWGQIQIANANKLDFNDTIDRKSWMLELCSKIDSFYLEEIGKIGERREWFEGIKQYWIEK